MDRTKGKKKITDCGGMKMKERIDVIGLGAGDLEQLPLGVYRKLKHHQGKVYVRTLDHPVIEALQTEGVDFHSFDHLYEKTDQFKAVYENITETLLQAAKEQPVLYAVPGHPMLAEKTVQLLLEQQQVNVDVLGGQSYLDDIFTSLQIDPIEGFQFMDGTDFRREELTYRNHLIFCQVYDAYIASEVKLTLLEDLPADFEVVLLDAVGTKGEKKVPVPLEELDRVMEMSNLTSVYVPPAPEEMLGHDFTTLRGVIRTLRGENGCPWDRKQTHESLRPYAIEEVYELIDAINREDDHAIVEELGDVLLQVLLHSQIGEDKGFFTIDEVIKATHDKMIHRHPHVFGEEGPHKTWDELKQEEKGTDTTERLLDSVIQEGPSLFVAHQLQKKAAKIGFDWDDVQAVWEKFAEEKAEFAEAVQLEDPEQMENEFGDILFVLANIARHHQIEPEIALAKTNHKFTSRIHKMEKQVQEADKTLADLSWKELNRYWNLVKEKERE